MWYHRAGLKGERMRHRFLAHGLTLALLISAHLRAQVPPAQLSPSTIGQIDGMATKALADSGTPSLSIAVVKEGRIAYVKAYGNARLEPLMPATPAMRYSIGSVSKQFMACAILLLAQEGKLSLDDPVSRFLPSLTRARDITIRELLSHTSGYQDYYPLDYVAPFMQQPVTAEEILTRWARKPLDFDPGTKWQYSNTNYVVAGRILEKVTGEPFFTFLKQRIFGPLGMTSVIDLDEEPLGAGDAAGYTHFGLGPARPVQAEARGWLFAAGERPRRVGPVVARREAAAARLARRDDYSRAAEEWRAPRLCTGRGRGQRGGLPQAVARRGGLGLRQR